MLFLVKLNTGFSSYLIEEVKATLAMPLYLLFGVGNQQSGVKYASPEISSDP